MQPPNEMMDIETLCRKLGIELRGDDGQPFCCKQRMRVKSGLLGADYAECSVCGLAVGNVASPHINGGYCYTGEWFEEHGDATWARMVTPQERAVLDATKGETSDAGM